MYAYYYLKEVSSYLHCGLHARPLLGQRNQVPMKISALLPKMVTAQRVRIRGADLAFVCSVPRGDVLINQHAQAAATVRPGRDLTVLVTSGGSDGAGCSTRV